MTEASPFLAHLDLPDGAITWCQPEIDCAHPLDDGSGPASPPTRSLASIGR
jgi:hypothetical protein